MAASPPAAPREQRVLLGIGFILIAASIFPMMNGAVKLLSGPYPTEQIVWARILGQLVVMLAVTLPRRGLAVLVTRRPWHQAGRSVCQLGSTTLFFMGLVHVPLVQASAISFLSPFLIVLLAWPVLGETLRARRVAAVALGFAGVLVVLRPGTDVFHPAALLMVASCSFSAVYHLLTRMVAGADRPETSAIWSALLGSLVLAPLMPFLWVTPVNLWDAMLFVSLGLISAAGHYCVALAFTHAPASVVAPFQYWQIVGATLVGLAIGNPWPDGFTWLGAGMVVAAGLFIAWSEGGRRGKEAPDRERRG
jgi:drug/metabolite transporter (DMT)-like permease